MRFLKNDVVVYIGDGADRLGATERYGVVVSSPNAIDVDVRYNDGAVATYAVVNAPVRHTRDVPVDRMGEL